MRRVLITGSRGFTGQYVAAELRGAGWEVWGTGLEHDTNDPLYRQLDICSASQCRQVVDEIRPVAVIHLAGMAFVDDDAEALYRVNLLGTRNLLSGLASLPEKPECIILASSANVYGNQTEGGLNESTPPNPRNDYAVSKLAMEFAAKLWMEELPIVITRPFNYTGVGQSERFLVPKIVSHFRKRAEYIELGNLDVSRDFSDVRSIAVAYRRLLEVCPRHQTINLCSGQSISLKQIVRLATEITGHHLEIRVNPELVRSREVSRLFGSPAKLKNLIGHWKQYPIQETLQWMISS